MQFSNQLFAGSEITVTFIDEASGDKTVLRAPVGKSVLDIALENKLNIEGKLRHYIVPKP